MYICISFYMVYTCIRGTGQTHIFIHPLFHPLIFPWFLAGEFQRSCGCKGWKLLRWPAVLSSQAAINAGQRHWSRWAEGRWGGGSLVFVPRKSWGFNSAQLFPPTSKATINGLLYTHPATIDDGLLTINCWGSPLARINWAVAQNSWNTYCPIRGN